MSTEARNVGSLHTACLPYPSNTTEEVTTKDYSQNSTTTSVTCVSRYFLLHVLDFAASRRTSSTMALQAAPVVRLLPAEIILDISDLLPPDAILALKLTHRRFNTLLSLKSRLTGETLSVCERLAIIDHLSRPNAQPAKLRCVTCKQRYPLSLFISGGVPYEVPPSFAARAQQSNYIGLPKRVCLWEVRRLMRIVNTGPQGIDRWVTQKDLMCLCCGSIKSWNACDCNCETCLSAPVRVYTRCLSRLARVDDPRFAEML